MRRLLLYVHYNKFNGIDDHVIYQLKNIRHIYDEIVFISNSKFSSFDYNLLCQQVQIENFLQRKNEGFDFGGWKDGISLIGKDKIKTFDSVTFMNDTCYGPLWDILPQYSIYEEQIQTIDFWGMTSHPSFFSNRKIVPKHLQSYFIVFQGTVLKSQYFFQFWDEITLFETIEEAIEFGEIHLTQYFLEKKYRYSSLLESRTDQKRLGINISMEKPEILLENKIPFIKVKAFPYNPSKVFNLLQLISKNSTYPTELIVKHQTNSMVPTPSFLGFSKKILIQSSRQILGSVAIIIFVDVENFELFIFLFDKFSKFSKVFDLFIVINDKQMKELIENLDFSNFKTVKIFENKSFFSMYEYVDQTDFVGIFDLFTKKSDFRELSNITQTFNTLIDNITDVESNFISRPDLGLVFADLSFDKNIIIGENKVEFENFFDEWSSREHRKQINFSELTKIIVPPYQSFWLKTEVMSKLTESNLSADYIIYLLWDIDITYAVLPNSDSVPYILQPKYIELSNELHSTHNEIEAMNFKSKIGYIFLPLVNIIKHETKKAVMKIYHLFRN